jgi:class 3 adenylate cyclase
MSTTEWSDIGVTGLPTGTVTLLLADVEGSTRLWETQPDEMAAAVARLDRVVTTAAASHAGVRPVEQGEGDSFVIAFGRATDAVGCALDLQRAPLAPIRLRIGIHTGDVRLRDEGNYVGPTINRTARLRDLAHGGQTVLSGTTDDVVSDSLPDGAWLNVSAPIRCGTWPGRNGWCNCATQTCATNSRRFAPRVLLPRTISRRSSPVSSDASPKSRASGAVWSTTVSSP